MPCKIKVEGEKKMGKLGVINVWIREPDDCTVAEEDGSAWARACCNPNKMYEEKLVNGHAEIEVPPGCYIVDAIFGFGCCGYAKETMVIVKCDEPVCVNLLREYAGEPIKSITAFAAHAEAAEVPEGDIESLVNTLEKIAGTVPASKIKRYTQRTFAIHQAVADEKHKKILNKYRSRLLKE